MSFIDRVKTNISGNMTAYILVAVSAVAGLISIITYPVSVSGTTAYFGFITAFTVIALFIQIVSVLFSLRGFAPLASLFFYSLALGFFIASRMEAFNLLQVGIGTFGNMGAYIATIVFYGIAMVACLVSAVMMNSNKE